MDIDYLIDRLEAFIQTGKRVPLSNKVMVDEQECYALIDQMRAVVPEEIKAAKRTLNDRERILDEADDSARQTLEQAEQERRMMIAEEGLLVEAERQRDIILSEAAQEAFEIRNHAQTLYDEAVSQTQEMRDGANQYAMQVLQELDNLLDKHLTVVRNGLQNFVQQSQQYQQQIDEYQRQYRPQYAPTKSELANVPARPATNGATPPPAARPRPTTQTPATSSNNSAAQQRPAPTAQTRSPERPAERAIERERPVERPIERPTAPNNRPTTPAASTQSRPNPLPPTTPNRPAAPTPIENRTSAGRLNLVTPNPLRPVPKPQNRSTDSEDPFDDYEEPSEDDRTAPPNNAPRRDVPPTRPPF